ncbi:hypothetical protein CBL_03102 [Carabus blaptoides fortunei]
MESVTLKIVRNVVGCDFYENDVRCCIGRGEDRLAGRHIDGLVRCESNTALERCSGNTCDLGRRRACGSALSYLRFHARSIYTLQITRHYNGFRNLTTLTHIKHMKVEFYVQLRSELDSITEIPKSQTAEHNGPIIIYAPDDVFSIQWPSSLYCVTVDGLTVCKSEYRLHSRPVEGAYTS